MARRDMVTRTVVGTKVTVKVVDVNTDALSKIDVNLPKAYELEDAKLTREVKKVIADNLVIVKVESVEPVNKLFGLDTAKFMELAMELDPETRKPLETATEETAE
jgi:hypothetical protein